METMVDSAESSTGTAAPYGQACSNCAKAKCRCVLQESGTACVRCQRLKKDCTPATQSRKRTARRKSPATRTQLEDKLDSLVTLLSAQHASSSAQPTGAQPPPRHESTSSHRGICSRQDLLPTPSTTGSRSDYQASPSSAIIIEQADHDDVRDNKILDHFCSNHLKQFPFIFIPTPSTAADIRRDRPFLWMNIEAICSGSIEQQNERGLQIREKLGSMTIVHGERTLDMLQGLLAHMAWLHYFSKGQSPFLGMLSGMAQSLVRDLRLDEPRSGGHRAGVFNSPGPSLYHLSPADPGCGTHEKRRALLACYAISSTAAHSMQFDYMRWSAPMEEAATSLSTDPQCPGDEVIAAFARICFISNEALKAMSQASQDPSTMFLQIRPLRAAMERVKKSLSPTTLSNPFVQSYIHNTEILIHESVLSQRPPSPTSLHPNHRRYEYLHASLSASKSCIENYLTFQTSQHASMTFFIMLQCLHALQVLYRLTTLNDPEWDNAVVRQSADVLSYFERMIVILGDVHAYSASDRPPGEESVWSKGAERFRASLPAWTVGISKAEEWFARQQQSQQSQQQAGGTTGEETLMEVGDGSLDAFMAGLSDDAWFADLFTPVWNYS
ncbi:hypothetical protein BU24DRAFT_490161 [Aaosphaeria arxii CBS 175.79]|uniref:Zn(2)-C6 fungal-type domain-containing protein n=1 Tax=Aaosphaeria arxii CBS 175.79 TaxID=1450172 RepID=A0A6A5XU97_9PLEO|nr:uncharacterized protein BU24DRAFT_490161 [Aaosphaeria arxii CBS 175.79]KAF2016888.1 hypothetical protein BU24DRAFT_490161 [Aaosphaeria arxii CBS 175.79]